MKNTPYFLLTLFLAISLSASVAQPTATTAADNNFMFRQIPADADQVFQVNLGSIGAKIDWLSIFTLFQKMHINPVSPGQDQLMDVKSLLTSGFDFRQNIVVAKTDAAGPDSIRYTTLLIPLIDSGKFVAALHTKGKKLHFLHLEGKERVAADSVAAYAWNAHEAVIVLYHLSKVVPPVSLPIAKYRSLAARRSLDALHGFPTSYFATDPTFNAQFSTGADVRLWNRDGSANAILKKLLQKKLPAAQLDAFSQMRPNTSHGPTFGALRFEPGKITYRFLKTGSAAEKANMARLAGQPLSNDLTAQIPAGELLGLVAIHLNIPALMDTLGKVLMSNQMMTMLKPKDLSSADILHALKGEFLVLAFNPDKTAPGGTAASKTPTLYLAASVNDPAAFTKLAGTLKLVDAASTPADTTADTTHHGPFHYYAIQKDVAVISTTRPQTMTWFNHPSTTTNPASRLLTDQVRQYPFSLSIDLQSAADYLSIMMAKGDTLAAKDKKNINAIRKMDALQISSGGVEDDGIVALVELRLTDPNKNGLTTLLEIFGSLVGSGNDH